MWLLMVPTLPAALQPLNGLQLLWVVVMSTQVIQVPVTVLLIMALALVLKVVAIAPVPRTPYSQCTMMIIISPLLFLQNAARGDSNDGQNRDGVDRDVTHARVYDDVQGDNDDYDSEDIRETILGHVGESEDAGYDNDGVDVNVGVDVGAVVGVGVHGQGVNWARGKRRCF